MTTSVSQIVDAFVAVLSEPVAVSAGISRARTSVISEDEVTAVNVSWEGSKPEASTIAGAPIDWMTRIVVECYARSDTQTGDVAIDPLLSAVYVRLASNRTLNGLVDDIGDPLIEPGFDAQETKAGGMRLTYFVEHSTANFNLE